MAALPILFVGGIAWADDPSGYWIMRAPVSDAEMDEGISYPKRYGTTGNEMFPFGNGQDVGVMWRSDTHSDEGALLAEEERHCGAWVNVYFDEPGDDSGVIANIYCHVWLLRAASLGMSTFYEAHLYEPDMRWEMDEARRATVNDYELAVFHAADWHWTFNSPEEFNRMSFKAIGDGGGVQLLSYPNQRSFCLVNLPDTETLQQLDSDGDGLDDYKELFVTFTDPYDADTDDDGFDDRHEFDNGKSGVDPYDWHSVHTYDLRSSDAGAFIATGSELDAEPVRVGWNAGLARSLDTAEFDLTARYDGAANSFFYDTVSPGLWGFLQMNYRYAIEQAVEDILEIQVSWGARNGPWNVDAWNDGVERTARIMNVGGGGDFLLPGRKGYSPAMFMKQLRGDDIGDAIDASGNLHYGYFGKQRRTGVFIEYPWEVAIDHSEVRVVTAGSYLDIAEPNKHAPAEALVGSEIELAFDFILAGRAVAEGVQVASIYVDDQLCPLLDQGEYRDGRWHVTCVSPAVADDAVLRLSATFAGTTLGIGYSRIIHAPVEVVEAVVADQVRKNRYISFSPGAAETPQAFRVTLTQSPLFPDSVGTRKWVGPPASDAVSELQCEPYFFSDAAYVVVGDLDIVPRATYTV